MQESMADLRNFIDKQRADVAMKSFERSMLSHKVTPVEESYNLVAARLEQAKIAESHQDNMPDIKLVADAVLPDKKLKPMRSLIVLTAMMMSFAASFALSYMKYEMNEALVRRG